MGLFDVIRKLFASGKPWGGYPYLIEFRFHGYAKKYLRELIWEVAKKYRVKGVTRKRVVPHITLFGPFRTSDIKEVINRMGRICRHYDLVPFTIKDFDHFENRVIFADIQPSEELKQLRRELSKTLCEISSAQEFDCSEDFSFHATIAFKDIEQKFDQIFKYLTEREKKNIHQYLLRVTLLKKGKIVCEYDLIQRKLLPRKQAKSKQLWKKTVEQLKEALQHGSPIIQKMVETGESNKVFFIGDLHLDHTNIIRYCNRPFNSTEEMNETIINNWNKTVAVKDTVYFLGDMAFGKGSRKASYWLPKLNGNIVFIEGNHEETGKIPTHERILLQYQNHEFLLIHNPELKPKNWNGWIIHGHKHNNDLTNYPFINPKEKTINVSAEMVNYTPINMEKILKEIEKERQ